MEEAQALLRSSGGTRCALDAMDAATLGLRLRASSNRDSYGGTRGKEEV